MEGDTYNQIDSVGISAESSKKHSRFQVHIQKQPHGGASLNTYFQTKNSQKVAVRFVKRSHHFMINALLVAR
jgi:hypothetical protein